MRSLQIFALELSDAPIDFDRICGGIPDELGRSRPERRLRATTGLVPDADLRFTVCPDEPATNRVLIYFIRAHAALEIVHEIQAWAHP